MFGLCLCVIWWILRVLNDNIQFTCAERVYMESCAIWLTSVFQTQSYTSHVSEERALIWIQLCLARVERDALFVRLASYSAALPTKFHCVFFGIFCLALLRWGFLSFAFFINIPVSSSLECREEKRLNAFSDGGKRHGRRILVMFNNGKFVDTLYGFEMQTQFIACHPKKNPVIATTTVGDGKKDGDRPEEDDEVKENSRENSMWSYIW